MATGTYSGRVLDGRYKLLQPLGKGGMGEVYLGRHLAIGKMVAVKLLRSIFADDDGIVKRFYREAQAASAIKHRNIIDVLDVGLSEWGDPYMVMEYLEGESLGDLLARRGPLDTAAACGVMEPALKALEAAHKVGVVHRDLKPDNIFLLRGSDESPRVKIIDFGISKFTSAEGYTKLTQDGSLLGTPSYMSPEQARGVHDIDGRADVYAMGVILYEMLTGELPFEGDNYNAILISVLTDDPRDPRIRFPDFPDEAEPVIMKALTKNADERYEGTMAMLADLQQLESFALREDALARLSRGLSKPSFAIGDLGHSTTTLEISDSSLEELVASPENERTPDVWEEKTRAGDSGRRGRSMLPIAGALVVLALTSLVVMWGVGLFESAPDEVVLEPIPPLEQQPVPPEAQTTEGALITVEGLPEGAKIFFDDVMVPMNPFRTEKRETIVTLRVEAEGFQTYSVAVAPSEDRIVEVELKASKKRGRAGKKQGVARVSGTGDEKGSVEKIVEAGAVLARAKADAVYNSKKGQLVECYNRSLASEDVPSDSPIFTKLKVKIRPSGGVEKVAVQGDGSKYSGLSACLAQTVKTWVFPPSEAGTTETFPINFTTK